MKRKGFTLIELLVVVAIIALLVAILVPSLKLAKDQARLAVCQAQLKSLGLALNLYAGNNDEYFPNGVNGVYPPGFPRNGWNVYMLAREGFPEAIDGLIGIGVLYPVYINDPHFFYCPQISVVCYPMGTPENPWESDPWSYERELYGWGPNWPGEGNPSVRIIAGYLYGGCTPSLTPDGYPRQVFSGRAIVTDVYTVGFQPSAHWDGCGVLQGNGAVFYYQNPDLNDQYPISSGTYPQYYWWDMFTNSES